LASLQPDGTTDPILAQKFTESLESFTRKGDRPNCSGGKESFVTAFGLAFSMFHKLVVDHRLLVDKRNAEHSSNLRRAIISMADDSIWKKVAFLRTWM
jgi:hypothetical protein